MRRSAVGQGERRSKVAGCLTMSSRAWELGLLMRPARRPVTYCYLWRTFWTCEVSLPLSGLAVLVAGTPHTVAGCMGTGTRLATPFSALSPVAVTLTLDPELRWQLRRWRLHVLCASGDMFCCKLAPEITWLSYHCPLH